jgi:hypothetical protein
MTKDEAQRSRWTFYEAVKVDHWIVTKKAMIGAAGTIVA